MPITLIAAVASNGTIGKDGRLVWRNKEDVAHFKELSAGKVVLMGRKTWESIPTKFRPLADRLNAVVTRQNDYTLPEGVLRFSSVDEALKALKERDIVVFGGAEIYAATMPRAERLELTEIDASLEGDTRFPEVRKDIWRETQRTEKDGFAFVTYERS